MPLANANDNNYRHSSVTAQTVQKLIKKSKLRRHNGQKGSSTTLFPLSV